MSPESFVAEWKPFLGSRVEEVAISFLSDDDPECSNAFFRFSECTLLISWQQWTRTFVERRWRLFPRKTQLIGCDLVTWKVPTASENDPLLETVVRSDLSTQAFREIRVYGDDFQELDGIPSILGVVLAFGESELILAQGEFGEAGPIVGSLDGMLVLETRDDVVSDPKLRELACAKW